MSSQKEIIKDDEVNIYVLISIIWENKLIIIFSTLIFTAIISAYVMLQKPVVPVFKSKTEIKSISLFNIKEYQRYNYFISLNKPSKFESTTLNFKNKTLVVENWKLNYFDNITLEIIDEKYLYSLFKEKLKNKQHLINIIKKSKIFNKEDYKTSEDYDNEILKLVNSIKLKTSPQGTDFLEAKTTDKKQLKNILNLFEKSINLEIQSYLKKKFSEYLLNNNILKKNRIEDLEYEILLEKKNIEYINWLNIQRKKLLNNKTQDRLKIAFNSTPIVTNQFFAGKINSYGTKFTRINKEKSNKAIIFLAVLLGAILSTIYVIIARNIRKSSSNL